MNTIEDLARVANGFGYNVKAYKTVESDGSWYCDITIYKAENSSKYLPEIYFDCMDEKFAMQTTAFGALEEEEQVNDYVMAIQYGSAFFKFLLNFDIHAAMFSIDADTKLSEPNKVKFIHE